VTDDRDFGELVFRLRQPHAGVIYLRMTSLDISEQCHRLSITLDGLGGGLSDFLVVSNREVRVRRVT
jgi:hypothetical protein